MMNAIERRMSRLTTRLWRDYKIKTQVFWPDDPDLHTGRIVLLNRQGICIRFCAISGEVLAVETNDSGVVIATKIVSIADIYKVTGDVME